MVSPYDKGFVAPVNNFLGILANISCDFPLNFIYQSFMRELCLHKVFKVYVLFVMVTTDAVYLFDVHT